MGKRLYVGNISYQASEDDLKGLFSQAGEVVSANLITDAVTGKLRGFGFVEMGTEGEAEKAISMFDGSDFMNRRLVVRVARPRKRPMEERRTFS
jgi:RNA recognition motif-containing protein